MEHEIIKMEREIADLKAESSALGEKIKTLFTHVERQDRLIETVNNLALSLKGVVDTQGQIKEKVDDLCTDVEDMKKKPAKRWESVVDKVIMLVIGAIAGLIFAEIGLQ